MGKSKLKEQLRDAYIAGFMSAGEGWNGEYPFDSADPDINSEEDHKKLNQYFEYWYRKTGVRS